MSYFKSTVIIFFIFATIGLKAQTEQQKQVQKVVINMFQGFADRDHEKIFRHCTNDVIILEHGVVWNSDSITAAIDKMKSRDIERVNSFNFISTEIQGNTAWVYYDNQADLTINGSTKRFIKWLESAVLVKEGSDWKIKLLHSTIVDRH